MNSDTTSTVTPQAQALSLYIQNAIEQLRRSSSKKDNENEQSGLIFLGNWQDAYPRLLVTDPVLEPVDKLVWQIIRIHVATPGAVAAFPGYEAISTYANIKSNHTIARALAILRSTRWLSLCARVRGESGRYLGNIYALHDEPVTLGDAMYLDNDYMAFLRNSTRHRHPRVRNIAESVLLTIQELIDGDKDAIGERIQTRSYERRLGRVYPAHQESEPTLTLAGRTDFFAISDQQIKQLAQQHNTEEKTNPVQILHMAENEQTDPVHKTHKAQNNENHRVQKMHKDENSDIDLVKNLHSAGEMQKLHTVERSSCSSNITTTTTSLSTPRAREETESSLHFPSAISNNERNLASMYLNAIDVSQQQDVLDEWHGRLQAAEQRSEPIGNPIGYLASLCRRAKSGEFQMTIGLRIRDQREQRLKREEADRQKTEQEKQQHAETLVAWENKPESEMSTIEKRMHQIRKRKAGKSGDAEQ